MKKKPLSALWTILLVFSFLLSACKAPAPSSSTESGSAADSTYQDSLFLVTDPYGPLLKETAASNSGYYELLLSADAQSNNILYTDFETQQRIYLCSNPSCEHKDEICTSWTDSVDGGGLLFTHAQTGCVYYVQRGLEDLSSLGAAATAKIFSLQPDGSGRSLLLDLVADGRICDAIAADSQYIYFDINTVKRRTAEPEKQTWRVSLADGKKEVLISSLPANYRLFGAFDTCLLFQEQKGDSCTFQAFDLRTQQFQELCGWQYSAFEGISIVYDHLLFVLAKQAADTGLLTIYDLRTGQTDTVENVPIYGGDITRFSGLWGGRYLLVDTTDNSDLTNIRYLRSVVDISEKTVTENTLCFSHNGYSQPIWVLAQNDGNLLVRYGEHQGKVRSLFEGEISEMAVPDAPDLAFITMEDFVQSIPNYKLVTDHVMQ